MEKLPEEEVNDVEEVLRQAQREYIEFLEDEQDTGKYHDRIKVMIEDQARRLIININDLRRKFPARADSLLNDAPFELAALREALKDVVVTVDHTYIKHGDFFVGFEGSFGSKHVTPRTLTSRFLGNLVCVEGIVTRCSLAKLKVVRSVHYCPATGKFIERKYTDLTSTDGLPTTAVYPTKDDDGNLLETEYGLSVYKDHQTLSIQEMPEKAPAGQLPRSVDIICDDDLVDMCKPGDRVQIVGCYRCIPGKQGGFTSGVFRTVVLANSISHLTMENDLQITRDDMTRCKKLARRPDIFELLSNSLAPSIHGHKFVKRAILCLLLGGCEKTLANGTRLRGDINVLLVGDPSVAKSQLLRYVLQTASRAVATTGRGSSGVGLTAAVTTDVETGERRLEAGAMILADRGVVCIDEFDKMSDIDRTAIHEVMEQGTVTIAKAGIHARLNARCSVLAAANPVYGRYDQYKTPMENIGMQDSLLSRFDLLFVLLDTVNAEDDGRIAEHVVRMHRWRNPEEQDGDVIASDAAAEILATRITGNDDEVVEVFEKYDPLLHGNSQDKDKFISMKFMRKYIAICKSFKPPVLTLAACDVISEEYSRLRSQDTTNSDIARTQPITARTLETLIRLSTAHAKARFSRTVDVEDANAAIELIQFAIFRKVLEKEKKKKRQRNESGSEEDEENEDLADQPPKRTRSSHVVDLYAEEDGTRVPSLQELREISRTSSQAAGSSGTPADTSSSDSLAVDTALPTQSDEISEERYATLQAGIADVFMNSRARSLPMADFAASLKELNKDFTDSELRAGLSKLTDENKVFVSNNVIYLI